MHILHVFDHSIPLHSGYTFRSRAILRGQQALGWKTSHITSPKHNIEAKETVAGGKETIDGLPFYRSDSLPGIVGKLPIVNQLAVIALLRKSLLRVAKGLKPDVIHAHSPSLNGVAAVYVGKKLGIPVVYEVRAFWEDAAVDHGTSQENGARYKLTRNMETWVLKRANAVTTICEGLRTEMIGRGIPESKITVIPNAVDLEQFSEIPEPDEVLRAELDLKGCTVLGFIGSFYAYEGLATLVEAMPGILQRQPKARLLLVGGGPENDRLQKLVEALHIGHAVKFTGRVPHSDVMRYYSLMDVMVYPREPMRLTELVTPLKPLEAMAQKKLVLASDVGGHKELIRDGETGWLFKAGDSNALVEKISEVLNQKRRWNTVRKNGLKYVTTERNWPVSVANYQRIYTSLI